MYRACIFDLDGTLTDSLDSLHYSVNETLKELGLGKITREQCRLFVGDGARCLIERALRASGDENLRLVDEAMQIYKRIFKENCTYNVVPYDGIEEMLSSLKARGMRLAVVSNKPDEQAGYVVEHIFGKGIFNHVQGQREDIPRKPAPDGVLFTMRQLNVEPQETVYIGDSDVDMETGKAAGVFTVGVSWGFRDRELLVKAGADEVIEHAEELQELL